MPRKEFHSLLSLPLCVALGSALLSVPAVAQVSREAGSTNTSQTRKPFAFEVLSIRPHNPGTPLLDLQYMPDGYRASVKFDYLIKLAYLPERDYMWSSAQLLNAPDWVTQDWYDIEARVAPDDMANWQQAWNPPAGSDSEFLRSAWQGALKQRCRLAFHITSVEVPSLDLAAGKQGIRNFQDTLPGAIKPVRGKSYALGKGFYIQDNGKRQFVGVTMEELALALSRLSKDYPVQDKTGIQGRFDFTLPWRDYAQYPVSEISNPLDRMPISSLGLTLKPGKEREFVINIDHIERPDPN